MPVSTTWTDDFSSGGAVIDGYDSTDSINLNNLTFLYQGDNPNNGASSYNLIPWQLGLATSKANIATSPTPTPTLTSTPTPVVASTWRVNAGGPAYTGSTSLVSLVRRRELQRRLHSGGGRGRDRYLGFNPL